MNQIAHWESIHKTLGCRGCRFCDKKMLFKGPCCQYSSKITVDKSGKCQKRREV